MLLLLLPLPRVCFCAALATLAFAAVARGDAVLLRFYPPPSGVVAGYRVYATFQTTGAITSAPIDAGARAPDATGIASYSLGGLDPARAYSVELTAYDSRGVESARSNRITIAPRLETLGGVLWSSNFGQFAPGVHPPGFVDQIEDVRTATGSDLFAVAYLGGNAAFGTTADSGMVSSRYLGSGAPGWGSYEIFGRVWTSGIAGGAGIDARSTDGGRYFGLGQVPGGAWRIRASDEPALTCRSSGSTGVTQPPGTWYFVRFRVTRASGLTRLRAKVWPSGAGEPAAWQADCWTTLAADADSGAFALRRNGAGGAYFDDLAVTEVIGTLDPIPPR